MKKLTLIALLVLLVAAIAYGFLNFSNQDQPDKKEISKAEKKKHSCCSEDQGTGEMSGNSIYQLDATWTDQDNKQIQLKDFKGKPVVLTMFFASCTYACPILVNDMKKIESELPKDEAEETHFVLISIDPERDTPEKLKQLAEQRGLNPERWSLLTGSKDDVMELAAIIGFKFKKEANGDYSHSNMINLLNEEGEIFHQQIGLNQDPSQTVNELKNL